MRNFLNISSFSLLNGLRFMRSLGLGLVLSAGFSSPVVFSDVIPVPTGPFADSSVITNLTFASVEDVLAFQSDVNNLVRNIDGEIYTITNGTARIDAAASQIYDKCNLILQDEGGVTGEQRDHINYIKAQTTTGYSSYNSNIPRNTRNINNAVFSIASDVDTISSAVDSIALYNANYATATFESGSDGESGSSGGCSCPDYTTILQSLLTALQAIQQNVSGIASTAGSMLTELSAIRVSQELTSAQLQSVLDYLTGSQFNGYFEDITEYLSVIEDDTAQFYIFWTQTFWQKFQDLYTQIDMMRADIELFADAVTNRLLLARTIMELDYTLSPFLWIGSKVNPRFALSAIGDFFSRQPSYTWGEGGFNFHEYLDQEFCDPILAFLGFRDYDDLLYNKRAYYNFVGPYHGVVSNLWETARPDGVESRGFLYDLWAEGLDDDANIPGMPTGREVSQQPMADAMIGLLYRIQYLLSVGNRPVDSNSVHDVISDVPPDAKRAASELLSLEFISPATTNFPFLRVYSSMKSALETFKRAISGIEVADTWLVLSEDGFSIEFTGSSGDPLISGSDRPIYITQPDFEGSHSAFFIDAIGKFMGVVWYGILGLVALAVTGFAFRFFWIATTFTIAVIGGDFSEAVEQFGNIGKSLTGGGD